MFTRLHSVSSSSNDNSSAYGQKDGRTSMEMPRQPPYDQRYPQNYSGTNIRSRHAPLTPQPTPQPCVELQLSGSGFAPRKSHALCAPTVYVSSTSPPRRSPPQVIVLDQNPGTGRRLWRHLAPHHHPRPAVTVGRRPQVSQLHAPALLPDSGCVFPTLRRGSDRARRRLPQSTRSPYSAVRFVRFLGLSCRALLRSPSPHPRLPCMRGLRYA